MANCKVIAVTNQKGSVGKTTTTANLGIGLAQQNKRVLLIDADAQGSLTLSLDYPKPDELPVTLADIMQNVIDDTPSPDGCGILHLSARQGKAHWRPKRCFRPFRKRGERRPSLPCIGTTNRHTQSWSTSISSTKSSKMPGCSRNTNTSALIQLAG